MREFGLGFDETLQLPLKRFWFLVNSVDRLRAEENLRQLQLLGSAGDAEALKIASETLLKEMGRVYVWDEPPVAEIRIDETGLDPEFDRNGLQRLKAMAQVNVGQAVPK